MHSFNNDYSEGAHPCILKAMNDCNLEQHIGYGEDTHTLHAANLLRHELLNENADIHFIFGGTQANLIAISSALRPHQAVISASTGHINVHETGAIEATGHKVIAMPCSDGKLTPSMIRTALDTHTDEHMVQPKMVYLSNATEVGTIYTKSELEALSSYCRNKNLFLYMDGARMGAALTSSANDLKLRDIAKLTDMFYIGGTKNGALFGEALVIINPILKPDFRYMIKQRGAMAAKGWLLAIQFEQLFKENLFFNLASHANKMADILRDKIPECGYEFIVDSPTNQLFPIFPNSIIKELEKQYIFSTWEIIDSKRKAIRLVTSWATDEFMVRQFIDDLNRLSTNI